MIPDKSRFFQLEIIHGFGNDTSSVMPSRFLRARMDILADPGKA
jgi:hypothetical protein